MTGEKSAEDREYEKRLRRRLKILQDKFKEGKIKFVEGLNVEHSLLAVQTGPDGEVDLDTVDATVRSMALAITALHDREELKKEASLSEIQNMYFSLIEGNFGGFHQQMVKQGLTPHEVADFFSKDKDFLKNIGKHVDEFLGFIDEFWEGGGEIAHVHVEDMNGNIKGIFGGDLFPTHNENIASKCGIYTDTIVLPDPFLRSKHIFQHYPDKNKAYYILKHALNILNYKDLACADVDVPIVVILPDSSSLNKEDRDFFSSLGEQDSLIHAGKLFGRKFESFEELLDFSRELDSIERAVSEIKDVSRVLFDTEWTGGVDSQLRRALEVEHYKLFTDSPGVILATQALGRMTVSNELLIKSGRLNGVPIIDAPTSWQYLTWKMEYDSEQAESKTGNHDLHIVKGLQDLSMGEMEWIGNIPPDALIDIRKQGAMEEIRSMLGSGVHDLVNSNPTNFHRSRDQIFDNIHTAFDQHKKNLDELRSKKWTFAGKDMGSWMVVGSLGITAAVTGMPVWGLAAIAADQLLDAPKLKDIPQSVKDLANESNKIKKSPVGMLFNISQSK